jgi:nitrogen fixation NifU-like protein
MNQKDPYLQKNHSLPYLKMAFLSDKHEIMENPDGYGKRTGVCGDTVEMFIRVRNERIQSVTFITNGCINTYACANTVALLAEGKTINKAWEITPEKVANYLKTLPKEDLHCAELAAGALYLAMVNYREYKNYPWKKPYQQRFR